MRHRRLNEIIAAGHSGASAMLSPLALRAAMPMGIPQQSAQAAACTRKATIGQITDGGGRPLALPSLARYFDGLDLKKAFLYAPQAGMPELRAAWARHLGDVGAPHSIPVVTAGMTHGLSLCAELFTSPDVPLVLAEPYWDNYDVIFTMRTGAPTLAYPYFDADRRFNVRGLADVLAGLRGPATVLLNFPSNPTGYSPYPDEVETLVRLLADHPHPLAVVCDDAYAGLFFDPELYGRSLFAELAARLDPGKAVVAKVDGATKELVFFGGRVGFVTFSVGGEAGEALVEKTAVLLRGTISSVSAPVQAAVLGALGSPTLAEEQAAVVRVLARRWKALKDALAEAGVDAYPFNSGCFALVPLAAGQDADEVRLRLIREQSLGVIAVPAANALRVAFCSVEEADVPDLVARLVKGIR
ncbi:MAG: aminotransferase class I/II-fold pyridoxal phosphate-dependent enzyme [Myxococcota bacterium]